MLAVIPIHKGDAKRAIRTLELTAKLGFIENHQLLVLYPQDTGSIAQDVLEAGRKAFQTVKGFAIPHAIPNEWPQGPNKMFATCCAVVQKKQEFEESFNGDYRSKNGAFLWWEPDMVPVQRGFLDRLQQQYELGQKPCLGVVAPTYRRTVLEREKDDIERIGRAIKFGDRYTDGEHMVLVGMYDRSIRRIINWIDVAGGMDEPIDVVLQGEILQRNGGDYTRVIVTNLIAHRWRSSNYRLTRNGESCDIECDTHEDAPIKGEITVSKFGHAGPAMIHGCKDESIYEVIEYMNGLRDDCPMELKPAVVDTARYNMEVASIHPVAPNTESAEVARLRKEIDDLKALMPSAASPKKEKKQKPKKARQEIDEKEVWETYLSILNTEGSGAAWRKTISKHKVTPTQLKVIRDKNTIPA